jgi:hypothetical protein
MIRNAARGMAMMGRRGVGRALGGFSEGRKGETKGKGEEEVREKGE